MTVTFDPTIIGPNMLLSSGNLFAETGPGTSATNTGVFGTTGISSGTGYFVITVGHSSAGQGIGITNVDNASVLPNLWFDNGCQHGVVCFGNGGVLSNSVFLLAENSVTGSWLNNDLITIFINASTQHFWVRRNMNNWNNSPTANPNTGVGGLDISGIGAGPYFPVISCEHGTTLGELTYNADFSKWANAPTSATVTLGDLWFGNSGSFVDLTVVGNRRKFISEAGCTVNLGGDGSSPFGRSPSMFLTVPTGGTAPQFAANNGNGGGFIISGGTLTLAGSAPCCTTTTTTVTNPPSLGVGVLGDYSNGNLYALNGDTMTDNGTPRKWLRRWRALEKPNDKATRFPTLKIDMETGAGVNPPAGNPHVEIRWSDDGGHTWSNPRTVLVGPVGATAQWVQVTRLPATRRHARSDRIFEISSTDPFKVAIVGAVFI